ncbi:MAG: hypothetical protein WC404_00100 [Candidatus Omnitrophota bacterium]|jgi:hypothetical protein
MSKVKWKVKKKESGLIWVKDGMGRYIRFYYDKALARRVCRLLNREEKERKNG